MMACDAVHTQPQSLDGRTGIVSMRRVRGKIEVTTVLDEVSVIECLINS